YRARFVGQRWRVPVLPVAGHVRGAVDHPEANPTVTAADQRESGEIPPDHGRRVGKRPVAPPPTGTQGSPPAVAAPLQPAPTTHGLREPATLLTIDQRPRAVQLEEPVRC